MQATLRSSTCTYIYITKMKYSKSHCFTALNGIGILSFLFQEQTKLNCASYYYTLTATTLFKKPYVKDLG